MTQFADSKPLEVAAALRQLCDAPGAVGGRNYTLREAADCIETLYGLLIAACMDNLQLRGVPPDRTDIH